MVNHANSGQPLSRLASGARARVVTLTVLRMRQCGVRRGWGRGNSGRGAERGAWRCRGDGGLGERRSKDAGKEVTAESRWEGRVKESAGQVRYQRIMVRGARGHLGESWEGEWIGRGR